MPVALSTANEGDTVTVATCCATTSADVLDWPLALAVMVTSPFPWAVARPFPSTVATASSDDVQVNATPETVLPAASRAVAENCAVTPSAVSVSEATETTMLATSPPCGPGPGSVGGSPPHPAM